MKSSWGFPGMVVGAFFLLLGVSILLKVLFRVDLPLIRISFALLIIYFGVKLLLGAFQPKRDWQGVDFTSKHGTSRGAEHSAVFSSTKWTHDASEGEGSEYNVFFGSGTLDLTKIPADRAEISVDVNTIFGETVVLLDPNVPTRIKLSAAFAEGRMPNGDMVAFGTLNYRHPIEATPRKLDLRGNVVFGSLRFVTVSGE